MSVQVALWGLGLLLGIISALFGILRHRMQHDIDELRRAPERTNEQMVKLGERLQTMEVTVFGQSNQNGIASEVRGHRKKLHWLSNYVMHHNLEIGILFEGSGKERPVPPRQHDYSP